MDTQALRQQLRQQRRALSDAEREHAAFILCNRISNSRIFKQSKHVAFYLANDGEMDLNLLIKHAWQQGKNCYLPVLAKPNTQNMQRLWFLPYTPNTILKNNRFGIPEPIHSSKTRFTKTISLDLVLMPLVSFDLDGNRLGMGGGFYDRTLSFLNHRKYWHKPNLLGTAYDFQKQDHIETNLWDIPMQAIATEKNFYISKKK